MNMSHRRPGILRTITVAFIAALLIGGAGAISASAAPFRAGEAATPTVQAKPTAHATPEQTIVGHYSTYSKCNAAGAKGVREGKWIRYLCEQIPKLGSGWFLSVEYGEKVINVSNFPSYRHGINLSITCAYFSGTLGWGGDGSIFDYAFVELVEPYSLLEDTCSSGYARVYVHYDTVDNPKTIEVIEIGPHRGSETPFLNEDNLNRYKDIYLYICSDYGGKYRCSRHVNV
jgi:hypothetical protein